MNISAGGGGGFTPVGSFYSLTGGFVIKLAETYNFAYGEGGVI